MSRNHPIKVVYRESGDKYRSKSFHILPRAQAFAKTIRDDNGIANVYVQGELFDYEDNVKSSAYSQSDEIPF